MGTKDNIIELIEYIEKDDNDYVIGIIKKSEDINKEKIEIYTNIGENPLDKLFKVLREYKKSLQPKPKIAIIEQDNKENPNDKTNL